tara:strand:- start:4470 stop:5153 length:684 start_codon:yes stop_codon:yes gene_type:complete
MSSLIASSSPWISENTPKKRTPSIRKTIKKRSANDEPDYSKQQPSNIEELQNISNERSDRVNELLNQMNDSDLSAENSELADFTPISPPAIQSKKDMQNMEFSNEYNPSVSSYLEGSLSRKTRASENDHQYSANDKQHTKLSNYNQSYEAPSINTSKPYYANMGISSSTGGSNDKLMERINYMVHLLEGQQHEKTDNITEEFILYTFLGVFVIFVVDSFARTGKYTR